LGINTTIYEHQTIADSYWPFANIQLYYVPPCIGKPQW
jgi:hypothetical protein